MRSSNTRAIMTTMASTFFPRVTFSTKMGSTLTKMALMRMEVSTMRRMVSMFPLQRILINSRTITTSYVGQRKKTKRPMRSQALIPMKRSTAIPKKMVVKSKLPMTTALTNPRPPKAFVVSTASQLSSG